MTNTTTTTTTTTLNPNISLMGIKLDGPVATNALDSSGEVLSIQGLDITDHGEEGYTH